MLIDIHTHKLSTQKNIFQILNIEPGEQLPANQNYCLGIHPWSLNENSNLQTDIQKLRQVIDERIPIALGEMGLDRAIQTSFELQINYLKAQIDLAIEKEINVIVIHCVKAYSDLISCLKSLPFKGCLILHDYNGNTQQTADFLKGNYYFSFSRALLNSQMKGYQSLKDIPLERIFLETDDQSDFSIEDLYLELADIKNVSVENLEQQLVENFTKIFKFHPSL